MYWIIIGVSLLASWIVSSTLKRKFNKYSQTPISSGMSGAEVAYKMLSDNGIRGVQILCTPGKLTDHYNPSDQTINLSEEVFHGRNAAAAAVAAHETGHAIQHAKAYSFLEFRSAMVPVLSFANNWLGLLLTAGVLILAFSGNPIVLGIGVIMFGLTTLFSFITLPVEFDASRRAMDWLKNSRVVNSYEHAMAKDALNWAAMTYVVAALSSLATLLYYASLLIGDRR